MQLLVIGCTLLTLSQREESTAGNWQLSKDGSAPIIRVLMISTLMISVQQCHAPVPPNCAQQYRPQVPISANHLCPSVPSSSAAQQCHPSVPSNATSQCPAV
ncbi:unnamed protein product, partial [Staurois parvus]